MSEKPLSGIDLESFTSRYEKRLTREFYEESTSMLKLDLEHEIEEILTKELRDEFEKLIFEIGKNLFSDVK